MMDDLATYREYSILQVGAGGNGSFITLFLSRLLAGMQHEIEFTYTIVDPDIVEQKNLIRQQFARTDLGRNKAEVLAERYGIHFGINIMFSDFRIDSADELSLMLRGGYHYLPILIGAVDNNRTRKIMHEFYERTDTIAYIDCGCEETYGQAVMGFKKFGIERLKPIAHYYPDILDDETPVEVGCAEAPIQNISGNIMSAVAVFNFLNNLIAFKKVPTQKVTYDAHQMVMVPEYIEEKS